MRTGKREDRGKPQTEREKESRKRIARDAKNFPSKKTFTSNTYAD
jgi:hypothetical protein